MASCGTQSKTWLLPMTTRPSVSWLTTSANSALTTLFVSPCAPATLASLALQTGPTFLSQGLARAVPFTLEPSPPPFLTLCLLPPQHPLGLRLKCHLLRGASLQLLNQSYSLYLSFLFGLLLNPHHPLQSRVLFVCPSFCLSSPLDCKV